MAFNPYLGIDLASYPAGRHLVRGVYGEPLLVEIAVDKCLDVGRIMDVHFWTFWSAYFNVNGESPITTFRAHNAVAFHFMRSDW
ncbi:MAG TPA: hypothetical protein VJS65_06500 [Verrucomicrobiae bacterium]|nr:hypothetical protein [Verrucomicrobiae bacterium]